MGGKAIKETSGQPFYQLLALQCFSTAILKISQENNGAFIFLQNENNKNRIVSNSRL